MFKVVRSSSTNSEVTDYYLDVIAKLLIECGMGKHNEETILSNVKKNDIIIVPTSVDFFKVYSKGYRRIVYWMQGLDAEESYMRNGSKIRRFVLDILTKFSMKKSLAIFYVSDEMKRYVEQKYHMDTDRISFIMPCFNVSQTDGIAVTKRKYEKNVFAYVGSLSKWQCFEDTLDFFVKIQGIDKDAELKVFTFAESEAKEIVKKKKINSCTVASVPPEKMTEALADVKFGFVLREDDPINRVATPTKLSSYLSAGVMPIFSVYLSDFFERTKHCEYVVPVCGFEPTEKLKMLMTKSIDTDRLVLEYMELFKTYYNPAFYISKYKEKMMRLLER